MIEGRLIAHENSANLTSTLALISELHQGGHLEPLESYGLVNVFFNPNFNLWASTDGPETEAEAIIVRRKTGEFVAMTFDGRFLKDQESPARWHHRPGTGERTANGNRFRELLSNLNVSLPEGRIEDSERAQLAADLARANEAEAELGRLGTNVLPYLVQEVRRVASIEAASPFAAREEIVPLWRAFEVIGDTAKPILPTLVQEFRSGKSIAPAAAGIQHIGATEGGLVLVEALTNSNSYIRDIALSSLDSFQSNAIVMEASIQPLLQLLGSNSQPAKALAARTLGRFRSAPDVVLPALLRTAKEDSDSVVRTSALIGIESFGARAGLIEKDLEEMAEKHPDARVRKRATEVLESIRRS